MNVSMSMLEDSLSKFPYLAKAIREKNFTRWADTNHYRTSYNDMRFKVYFD